MINTLCTKISTQNPILPIIFSFFLDFVLELLVDSFFSRFFLSVNQKKKKSKSGKYADDSIILNLGTFINLAKIQNFHTINKTMTIVVMKNLNIDK